MANIGETLTGSELIITILLIIFFPPYAICYVIGDCKCTLHVCLCTICWLVLFALGGSIYAAIAIFVWIEEDQIARKPGQNVA